MWVLAQVAMVAPVGVVLVAAGQATSGAPKLPAYLAGAVAALAIQNGCVWALRRRIGPERSSPADLLTHARGAAAAMLVGLVVTGYASATPATRWLAFALVLLCGPLDWLDGPLARHFGPTQLGRALDIEADSWLTLWCAAGAVALGVLPWWCLAPPVAHYLLPVHKLRHGHLPSGGGSIWSRVVGVAQMVVFLAALTPVTLVWLRAILVAAANPVCGLQLFAILSGYSAMRKSVCSEAA